MLASRRSNVRISLLARVFVALTLGLAFAHVLELTGKRQLAGPDWLMVQQHLYVAFGSVGAVVELLAITLTWLTLVQRRRAGRGSRRVTVAALSVTLGLIVWALVVSPMNGVLNAWTAASLPDDWSLVRNRWELGHAIQAAHFAVGFIALEVDAESTGG
jgi:hypothetical protein